MKEFKVTVYMVVPFETIVEADSEAKAKDIALERDLFIPYLTEESKYDDFVIGDIDEFPNLGKNESPEVEEI